MTLLYSLPLRVGLSFDLGLIFSISNMLIGASAERASRCLRDDHGTVIVVRNKINDGNLRVAL